MAVAESRALPRHQQVRPLLRCIGLLALKVAAERISAHAATSAAHQRNFCLWFATAAFLLSMSVQSVEGEDACRTCGSRRAMDGSSYYVTLSHMCRDDRIGTGIGKPMVGLPPAFGLGQNKMENTKEI